MTAYLTNLLASSSKVDIDFQDSKLEIREDTSCKSTRKPKLRSVITATFTGPRRKSMLPKAARPAAPCATYCYAAIRLRIAAMAADDSTSKATEDGSGTATKLTLTEVPENAGEGNSSSTKPSELLVIR